MPLSLLLVPMSFAQFCMSKFTMPRAFIYIFNRSPETIWPWAVIRSFTVILYEL